MNILVSFSGGRTSAYMAKMMKMYSDDNLLFVFANTGMEHENTLEFIDQCDKAFDLNLVWVEADVHHGEKIGTGYYQVDFLSADRSGIAFEEVIKKYGIPNKAYPHCNRELKLAPIHVYAKEYFGDEKYKTAIGIRVDETRRVSKYAEKAHSDGIIYPLIDQFPVDKIDINDFWEGQDFNLEIPEHYGNCTTCWKKSDRKLFTVMSEHPEWFDFFDKMEEKYPFAGSNDGIHKRVLFRKNRSTKDMFKQMEAVGFKPFIDSMQRQDKLFGYDLDDNGGCSESCEMLVMDE